jgi:hypothetical protein
MYARAHYSAPPPHLHTFTHTRYSRSHLQLTPTHSHSHFTYAAVFLFFCSSFGRFPPPGGGELNDSFYEATAATGVELLKVDYGWYDNQTWQWRPKDWPKGFDYTPKAHKAGLKTSLYMGGT